MVAFEHSPMTISSFTFGAEKRLKSTAEFDAVYNHKKSAADSTMILFAKRNDGSNSRIGLSVSKKHGNAPKRNRIKRLLRETFRTMQHDLPLGVDFVVVPKAGATFELRSLKDSLGKLAAKVARRLEPIPRTEQKI